MRWYRDYPVMSDLFNTLLNSEKAVSDLFTDKFVYMHNKGDTGLETSGLKYVSLIFNSILRK